MRRSRSHFLALFAAIALTATSVSFAQEDGSGPSDDGSGLSGDGSGESSTGDGDQSGNQRRGAGPPRRSSSSSSSVADGELTTKGSEYVDEMKGEYRESVSKREEAKKARDAVKTNYINQQLATMKGMLRISEDALLSLQEAVASGEMTKARYEFDRIATARDNMKELAKAVQNATGSDASYSGGTQVTVILDDYLRQMDEYYNDGLSFFASPENRTLVGDDGTVGSGNNGVGDLTNRPQPAASRHRPD